MLMGSMVESYGMGPGKMALLYFVSTIGGYLFGSATNYYGAVGCGPAVYGFIACLFSNIVVNWKALAHLESMKFCLIFIVIMLFAMTMLMTYQKAIPGVHFERSDISSNMGGLMAGLFFSMAILNPARAVEAARAGSYEKKVSIVGYACTAIYFLTCFLCFFLSSHPINYTRN
jgi:hypothetical protein